ncbi:hypothetical protein SY94_0712 [Agrobacterium tumefaciens]|nr:hypothetical protein SY94_0712 [Agrobacterium tumefaciens]
MPIYFRKNDDNPGKVKGPPFRAGLVVFGLEPTAQFAARNSAQ